MRLDTDGDGVYDIWGTGATAWGNETISNGVQFIGQNAEGKWVCTIKTPEGIRALQFLYDMNSGCRQNSARCKFYDEKLPGPNGAGQLFFALGRV